MNNPRAKENLKPFKKGVSGNKNGRPKKLPQLDVLLADVLGEEKDGVSAAKVILMALRKKATQGDVRAAEVLLDRAFGRVKQPLDISADVTGTIAVCRLTPSQIKALNAQIEDDF